MCTECKSLLTSGASSIWLYASARSIFKNSSRLLGCAQDLPEVVRVGNVSPTVSSPSLNNLHIPVYFHVGDYVKVASGLEQLEFHNR